VILVLVCRGVICVFSLSFPMLENESLEQEMVEGIGYEQLLSHTICPAVPSLELYVSSRLGSDGQKEFLVARWPVMHGQQPAWQRPAWTGCLLVPYYGGLISVGTSFPLMGWTGGLCAGMFAAPYLRTKFAINVPDS